MPWSVKLQNALVHADKCLGVGWEKMFFGKEEETLATHGIILEEMSDTVFRWVSDPEPDTTKPANADDSADSDGWTTVKKNTRKDRKKKNPAFEFALSGIYV